MNAIDALAAEVTRLRSIECERQTMIQMLIDDHRLVVAENERLTAELAERSQSMQIAKRELGKALDAEGRDAVTLMLNAKTRINRLTAELAQARQWAKAWKQAAHKYRVFAALWRERANRFEALVAAEQHDNVPAYTEETG